MTEETKRVVVWEADSTHPELSAEVKTALREVIDPELGLNIIELGLVRDLTIAEDKGKVTMIMTTPFCPYAPALLEMTRKKAETALDRPAMIEMGMEMWDLSYMEEGVGADWGLF
jgi:metal-sulfur cluster biosynthetic enzyme